MITVNEKNGSAVAIIEDDGFVITDVQSALDLMATASHEYGCDKLLVYSRNICSDFFELRTTLAGEILQKFSNYGVKIAIVGDFSNVESKSLRDFIYECNSGKQVFFVATKEDALEKLHGTD